MALDKHALEAVAMLLEKCEPWLAALGNPQSKTNLKGYLDINSKADRPDYDEIIATADSQRKLGKSAGGSDDKTVNRHPYDPSIITAPFRFIDLPDQIAVPETEAPPALDMPVEGHFCGTISYELFAETPLLIGGPTREKRPGEQDNPAVEPLKLGAKGTYVIPGATMRGMIRAACEIVGYAKLTRGNWHHRYGMRDFEHRLYREKSVSKSEEVHSGFLVMRKPHKDDDVKCVFEDNNEDFVFELTPCRRQWAQVPVTSLAAMGMRGTPDRKDRPRTWVELGLDEKYSQAGMLNGKLPVFTRTYGLSATSSTKSKREMSLAASGGEPGVLVFAGKFPGNGKKKFEYAFFPADPGKPVLIPRERAELFIALNSKPSKNKPEPDGSWKVLKPVAKQGRIPVFYVGKPDIGGKDFFFGLTRLFKIPHDLSVGDVLLSSQGAHKPDVKFEKRDSDGKRVLTHYKDDFVERLFGYVIEPKDVVADYSTESFDPKGIARKGRVAFGFAMLDMRTPVKVEPIPVSVVQMAPRASFAPFYLRSDGKQSFEKDYSVGDIRLAGRKAYFPRYTRPEPAAALQKIKTMGQQQIAAIPDAAAVQSNLRFLMPAGGAQPRFSGEIRLHNVSAAEIGLVLFALTHGGDKDGRFRHMMGRAKPFGAGQMRLGGITLELKPNHSDNGLVRAADAAEAHDPATGKGVATPDSNSPAPFLQAFEQHMRKFAPGFPAVAPVEEWLGMCDPAQGEKAGNLDYQPLPSFNKIRKMFKPLPGASKKPEPLDRLLAPPRVKPAR
jgi:CRISPR-associated protein (TIGR03986 family)